MAAKPQKPMTVIMPDAVRLRVKCRGKMAEFVYEEDFTTTSGKKLQQGMRTAIEALHQVYDDRIKIRTIGSRTVRMSGRVERTMIGDMMAGEFSCWGTASEMTMREMMMLAVVARATQVKHHRQVLAGPPQPATKAQRAKMRKASIAYVAASKRIEGCAHLRTRKVKGLRKCLGCWALEQPCGGDFNVKAWVPNIIRPRAA